MSGISFSTVKEAFLQRGTRILKVIQYGAKSASEAAPFGDDSNPVPGLTAIYADTADVGEPVIVGYINTKQLADTGEKRLYSLKADRSVSFYLWLHNDGTMDVGGTADNLVRYTPLNTGLQATMAQINTELAKISAAVAVAGGTYVPGTVSTAIGESKIEEIKCL